MMINNNACNINDDVYPDSSAYQWFRNSL